jgi:hypothetical protein
VLWRESRFNLRRREDVEFGSKGGVGLLVELGAAEVNFRMLLCSVVSLPLLFKASPRCLLLLSANVFCPLPRRRRTSAGSWWARPTSSGTPRWSTSSCSRSAMSNAI